MPKKNFLILSMLFFFLTAFMITYAQEKPVEKTDNPTTMQQDDMQKCIDKIAADSTLRMQMMDKIMGQCKADKTTMIARWDCILLRCGSQPGTTPANISTLRSA